VGTLNLRTLWSHLSCQQTFLYWILSVYEADEDALVAAVAAAAWRVVAAIVLLSTF